MEAIITKWGNGHGVRLSKSVLDLAGMKERDKVQIIVNEGVITFKKPQKRPYMSLKERLEGFDCEGYVGEEWDTGAPVGNEIW